MKKDYHIPEYQADRYAELKELGLCPDCGEVPVESWETLCPACRAVRMKFYRKFYHWYAVVRPVRRKNG